MNNCPESEWSAVATAGAISQLASVLAGFVFAGLVLLLNQHRPGSTRIRAISLFCAGFFVLGLASYLFGLVTGDNVETACKRVWTEVVIASGILGVGAIGVVSGIGWLLAAYLGDDDKDTTKDLIKLGWLLRLMLYGLALITTILVFVTVIRYLIIWFDGRPPWLWLTYFLILYFLYLTGLAWFTFHLKPDQVRVFFFGVFWLVIYAILGTIIDGFIVVTDANFWASPPAALGVTAAAFTLFLLAPPIVALIYAVPHLPHLIKKNRDKNSTEEPENNEDPPAGQDDDLMTTDKIEISTSTSSSGPVNGHEKRTPSTDMP